MIQEKKPDNVVFNEETQKLIDQLIVIGGIRLY